MASAFNINPHQLKDEENSSSRQAFAYASLSDTGEDKSSDPSDDEAIFIPEADEIELDNCPLPEVQTPDNLDGPHTGDQIEVGGGAFAPIVEEDDDAETPDPEDDFEPLEGTDEDYADVLPFDSHQEEKQQAWR